MCKAVTLAILFGGLMCFGFSIKPKTPYNSRIFGGDDAAEGQFPFQVSLRRRQDGVHQCGGSIINSKWILSAAHCVISSPNPENFVVVAGSVLLSSGGVARNVSRIIYHPQFNVVTFPNDIAVLELAEELTYTDLIQPIELETEFVDVVDSVVSGWGYLFTDGPVPDNLQYLRLPTISLEECRSYPNSMPVYDTEICTLSIADVHGMCYGDSGGPLVSDGRQIGIVSWGRPPCEGGMPDVYVRVSSFIDWIDTTIST